MRFEAFNINRENKKAPDALKTEEERKIDSILEYLKEYYSKLRKEGLPVLDDGRIDSKEFIIKKVYNENVVNRDNELIERWRSRWDKEQKGKGVMRDGEKLEILKSAIFQKFVGDKYYVFRSSLYDDVINKVDNIIIDRETGNIVCAFDEVADIEGPRFQQKQQQILERNLNYGGGKLKYGIEIKNVNDKKEIGLGEVKNIPLFYIALPKNSLNEGIDSFIPSSFDSGNISDFEKKFFEYVVNSLKAQISALELREVEIRRYPDILKKRIKDFKKTLDVWEELIKKKRIDKKTKI